MSVFNTLLPSKNSTLFRPTPSEALAEIVILPRTIALFVGEVMETVGKVLSTVTETLAEVKILPALSVARADKVWAPSEKVAVFQLKE